MRLALVASLALAACGSRHPEPTWVFQVPRTEDGRGPGGARHARVVLAGNGEFLLGWEVDGPAPAVIVSDDKGLVELDRPGAPIAVSGVDLAAASDGSAAATWWREDTEGSQVLVATRSAAGAWSEGRPVSFPPRAYQPQLAAQQGGWVLVWDQWYGSGYGVAVANGGPGGWSLPTAADDVLSPDVFYANAPRIAAASDGSALITWYQSTSGPLAVFASSRPSATAPFSKPAPADALSDPATAVDSHPVANPRPAVTADGRAAVVWTQDDGAGHHPVYLARRDATGAWHRPDAAFSLGAGTASCAQVAFDGAGTLWVAWYQDLGQGEVVLASRIEAGDFLGGAEIVHLSASGASSFAPTLVALPDGGAAVAYVERSDGPSRVAVRIADGAGVWSPARVLSPDAGDATDPSAAAAADAIAVAWTQGPPGSERAYVAKATR